MMNCRLTPIAVFVAACFAGMVAVLPAATVSDQQLLGRSGDGFSLRLMGTAVVENSSFRIAVMAYGPHGRQRIFYEGDWVDDVRINKILSDRVEFLTRQGRAMIVMTGSRLTAIETKADADVPEPLAVAHGPRPLESRRHDNRSLDRRTLTSALANIDDILQDMSIETVMVYGKPAGVRIAPVEPGNLFSIIGLKAGEMIQQVNDATVSLPEQTLAIFQQLREGKDVDIKVKGRRTRWIHLTVH